MRTEPLEEPRKRESAPVVSETISCLYVVRNVAVFARIKNLRPGHTSRHRLQAQAPEKH